MAAAEQNLRLHEMRNETPEFRHIPNVSLLQQALAVSPTGAQVGYSSPVSLTAPFVETSGAVSGFDPQFALNVIQALSQQIQDLVRFVKGSVQARS